MAEEETQEEEEEEEEEWNIKSHLIQGLVHTLE